VHLLREYLQHYADNIFSIFFHVGTWSFHSVLDKSEEKSSAASDEGTSNVSRARELFKSKTIRGQDIKADTDVLKTKHERLITHVRNAGTGPSKISKVSTTGMDGKLVMWNLSTLESAFSKLSL
jgi:actin related protein 2/3 complex subunit 1A/1B